MSNKLPYGGGCDNTFGCYVTNYVWGGVSLVACAWVLVQSKHSQDRYLGWALLAMGLGALSGGICHHFFNVEETLEFRVCWALTMWMQVISLSSYGVASGWNTYASIGVFGVLSALCVFLPENGPCPVSAAVGLLCSCVGFACLIAIAVQKLKTWREYLLLMSGVWGISFQTMYLLWWRSSCHPTGPVPETWPEDALFSCDFNHNAWFHVCYMVHVLMVAASVNPRGKTDKGLVADIENGLRRDNE